MFERRLLPLVIFLLIFAAATAFAQTDTTLQPQKIQDEAVDGLMLTGDYYAAAADGVPDTGLPAVLLMHEFYAARSVWRPLINPLLDAGYHVLGMPVADAAVNKRA